MFPASFADDVVLRLTGPNEGILDPFAGRGTAVFSASMHGRRGVGIEINPVGWIYGAAKLEPADARHVARRIVELGVLAGSYTSAADDLPIFFHRCYTKRVRAFLLAARAGLDWRRRSVDRTAMALLLIYLHGKRSAALSNQMRQTKAVWPGYAIRWWDDRDLNPPDVDPVEFMLSRLRWRYAAGVPRGRLGRMYLGDSRLVLPRMIQRIRTGQLPRMKLLLTSPPYFGLTNYHYDQWLRLWLLGGEPNAFRSGGSKHGKFEHRERYQQLLADVFRASADLLSEDAVIYVRTGRQTATFTPTAYALREAFPGRDWIEVVRPYRRPTQTALFGDKECKSGEVDLISDPTPRCRGWL